MIQLVPGSILANLKKQKLDTTANSFNFEISKMDFRHSSNKKDNLDLGHCRKKSWRLFDKSIIGTWLGSKAAKTWFGDESSPRNVGSFVEVKDDR